MPKYLTICTAANCNHSTCARLREFETLEKLHKIEISPNTKFEAVCEEMSRDNKTLELEKQALQEENDKVNASKTTLKAQREELFKVNGTLKQTVVQVESQLAKAAEEVKRAEKSHQSELNGLMREHAKAIDKAKRAEESYQTKFDRLMREHTKSTDEAKRAEESHQSKLDELIREHTKTIDEAKRAEASHQSALKSLMKGQAIAETKSNQEIEKYRRKCTAFEKAILELEEANRSLVTSKVELTKNVDELAVMVKDLKSQVQELNEALVNSENYLFSVRESLQEEKNRMEALKEEVETLKREQECSADHKEWVRNQQTLHFMGVQDHMEQLIYYTYKSNPGDLRNRPASPNPSPAQKMAAEGQLSTVDCQDSLPIPAAPPGPPTPTSLAEIKTAGAPQGAQQQEKKDLPPKPAESPQKQAAFTFHRQPPRGPKRSISEHPEGRGRSRRQSHYDSYRPGECQTLNY